MWETCDTFLQFWIHISSTLYKLSITPVLAEVQLVFCVLQTFVMKILQGLCAFYNLIVIKYICALEGFSIQYVYGINLKIVVDFCQRWFRSKCFIQALVGEGRERSGIDIEELRKIISYSLCSSCKPFFICDMRNKVSYFAAIQKVALCTAVFSKQMDWWEQDLTQMPPRWLSVLQVDT
jgi:hypothetical protein